MRQTDAPPLQVNVRIIDGEKRFEAYRNRRAPGLTTNSGFLGDTTLWLNEGLFEDAAFPRERYPGSLRGPAPDWRTWLGAARPQALSL